MKDIGIELYEAISAEFQRELSVDKIIGGIMQRIESGKAQSTDIARYANRLGQMLRTAIERNVSADKLPDGQMYYNIAEKILRPSLKNTYDLFNDTAAKIQAVVDQALGINIKAQKPEFPNERIDDVIGAASVKGIPENQMIRRLASPAENIVQSYADDYAKVNADFRSRAGLTEYIIRRDDGNCCEWCSHLAGRYRYPDEVPKDVYRRHDNCGCIVEHQSGGMRKNVHTKSSGTDEQQREALRELNERKQQQREKIRQAAENVKKPRVLSKAEGSRIEAEVLAKRRERLTGGGESGIITSDTRFDMDTAKINKFLLLPGAKHSKEFFDVGYTQSDGQRLYDDISSQFDLSKATDHRINPSGNPGFSIFMMLGITKERTFRTTWETDPVSGKPRFTSAYRDIE